MAKPLHVSAKRVQDALQACGLNCRVAELPQSTRTAAQAAQAIGCQVGQIVKSLVFRGAASGQAILVLASGANRVDEQALSDLVGETVEMADADFVRAQTGFAIGGVPPVGHLRRLVVFIDEDLLQYETVWAAAGTPHAVFEVAPGELVPIAGGRLVAVKGQLRR